MKNKNDNDCTENQTSPTLTSEVDQASLPFLKSTMLVCVCVCMCVCVMHDKSQLGQNTSSAYKCVYNQRVLSKEYTGLKKCTKRSAVYPRLEMYTKA